MRGKVAALGAVGAAAAAAFSGASINVANAAACVSTSLAVYESQGSCTIGDKIFSNFTYLSTTGITNPANVAVGTNPSPLAPIGLSFAASWTATAKSQDVKIGFDVTLTANAVKAGTLINDANIHFGGATPGSTIVDDETISSGHTGITTSSVTMFSNTDHVSFSGHTQLSITNDTRLLTAGSAFSNEQKDFSQTSTPEPTTLSLLGVGLGALGLVGIRRRKRSR